MYIPFDSMPPHSRVWIYQANRAFSGSEKEKLRQGLKDLCEHWAAHGTPLHTSFNLQLDQFVIMAVDEQPQGASGCSIDGSVRYLKSLQTAIGLDFFDRTGVAFLEEGKVTVYPVSDLKTLFGNKTLSNESIAFNNLVGTKADWLNHWQTPVKDSWLARYLPKTAVSAQDLNHGL